MKAVIISSVVGVVMLTAGFFTGKQIGYNQGSTHEVEMQQFVSIDELKSRLYIKEREIIGDFVSGDGSIKTYNEGGLFKKKYVQYFTGNLQSSAVLTVAKDVRLNVDFYSKTGTKIGSQEITVYEFIVPGGSVAFKEKIDVPERVDEFKFQIMSVDYAEI